jgi:hypothetical protein
MDVNAKGVVLQKCHFEPAFPEKGARNDIVIPKELNRGFHGFHG